MFVLFSEAATGGVQYKKVFLEISQNSHGNTCAGLSPAALLKKHRRFPVNFVKILLTPFLKITSGRLLLCFVCNDIFTSFLVHFNLQCYRLI